MFAIEHFISYEVTHKIGWVLLHFIWQAAVVALVLAFAMRIMRRFSANARYITSCIALLIVVVTPLVTMNFIKVSTPPAAPTIAEVTSLDIEPVITRNEVTFEEQSEETAKVVYFEPEPVVTKRQINWKEKAVTYIEPKLSPIVTIWLFGVCALAIWHLGGYAQLQKLRKKMVKQVDFSLNDKLEVLAKKLGVTQTVQLLESALVQIPTVVGWLKPVILLPASALTGLTTEQLEAILAHELAHIKRYDYLINILQTIVEILGFYHPAVWWISHIIRHERENCCDDLAVAICGDKIHYAKALASMEEIRGRDQLAIAATGGNLLSRICRLIGKDTNEKNSLSWIPALTVILLLIALAIPTTIAFTSSNNMSPSAQFILSKMLEHRDQAMNIQYVSENILWHDPKIYENEIRAMTERGEPKERIAVLRELMKEVPENRYQILKCTIDNAEHAKIELTTGTFDSSGNKVPENDKQIWSWNGQKSVQLTQSNNYPGSATIEKTPNMAIRLGHPWRTYTGELCNYLEIAIKAGEIVNIEELEDGTYRITFNYQIDENITRKIKAIIDPSKGYTCTLQDRFNENGELGSQSKAKYEEIAEGLWFPISGETITWDNNGLPVDKSTVTTRDIVVNDPAFNISYFNVDIPVGATVKDRIQDTEYVQGVDRKHDLNVLPDETEQIDPNSWEEKFNSIYSLKDGEILKRISPFIPERHEYLLNSKGKEAVRDDIDLHTAYVFLWNGNLESKGAVVGGASMSIINLLQYSLGIMNYDLNDPDNILKTRFAGDWIVRKNASKEEVLAALEKIIKDEMGREIKFVKQNKEDEVIIAKGKYNFKSLPNVKDDEYVLISTKSTDTYPLGAGGGTGTITKFLTWIGRKINMNITDNTESSDTVMSWRNHDSSNLGNLDKNSEKYNTQLDLLLKNLSAQTGLTFERTKADVEKWDVTENRQVSNLFEEFQSFPGIFPVAASNETSDEKTIKRVISAQNMKHLGLAVVTYANDNNSDLPETLEVLKPYFNDERIFEWTLENIKYIGEGTFNRLDSFEIPIAYDNKLEDSESTNFLFMDGHVDFQPIEKYSDIIFSKRQVLINMTLLEVPEDLNEVSGIQELLKDENLALNFKNSVIGIFDESHKESFLNTLRSDDESKILASPAILIFEREIADLMSTSKVPLITGYSEPTNPYEEAIPITEMRDIGIKINARPIITPDNKHIRLTFKLKTTDITGYKEQIFNDKYTANIPQFHEFEIETEIRIPKEKSVLFNCGDIININNSDEKKRRLVLIKTYIIPSEQTETSRRADSNNDEEDMIGPAPNEYIINTSENPSRLKEQNQSENIADDGMVQRTYDISDLVSMPTMGGGMMGGMMDVNSSSYNQQGYYELGGYGGGMMGGYGSGYGQGNRGVGVTANNSAEELKNLIMQLIEPESWYELNENGKGTIYTYPVESPKKMLVTNTVEVHKQIEKLLESLRKGLGEQVAIEIRFIYANEQFINLILNSKIQSSNHIETNFKAILDDNAILDDLMVSFLIRAAKSNLNAKYYAKYMAAPNVTVLNGEIAQFESNDPASPFNISFRSKPTILHDNENVLLDLEQTIFNKNKQSAEIISKRVVIPDGQTFAYICPVSKSQQNNQTSTDTENMSLIVLVRPTIILQEEIEASGDSSNISDINKTENVQPTQKPIIPNVEMVQRSYDISDFLGTEDSNIPDSQVIFEANQLRTLIREIIEYDSWYENNTDGYGTLNLYPQKRPSKILVTNSISIQEKVEKLLNIMRASSNVPIVGNLNNLKRLSLHRPDEYYYIVTNLNFWKEFLKNFEPIEVSIDNSSHQNVVMPYDVSDIDIKAKVDIIKMLIAPDTWQENNPQASGRITVSQENSPNRIIVSQTRQVHKKIANLLSALRPYNGPEYSPEDKGMVQRTFEISDIVYDIARKKSKTIQSLTPLIGGMGGGSYGIIPNQALAEAAQEIVKQIMDSIEPDSWYDNNEQADGAIYPYPVLSPKKLAVTNTPEVHLQIEKYLESIRESIDYTQVAIEMRYIYGNEQAMNEIFNSIGIIEGGITNLDDTQVIKLIKDIQKNQNIKSLALPKVTVLNDETAIFQNMVQQPISPDQINPFFKITPHISEEKNIVFITFDNKRPLEWNDSNRPPDITAISMETRLTIVNGQTCALSIYENNQQDSSSDKKSLILIKPTIIQQNEETPTHVQESFGSMIENNPAAVPRRVSGQTINSQSNEPNQVLIETQIIQVSNKFLRQLGLDAYSLQNSDTWTKYRVDNSNEPNLFVIDELSTALLKQTIDANKESKVEAKPAIYAQTGKQAEMKVLTEDYYILKKNNNSYIVKFDPFGMDKDSKLMYNRQELFKFTSGTTINLEPEIIDDNIQLELEINIGDVITNEKELKVNDITISDGTKPKDKIQKQLPKEVSLYKESFNVLIPNGKSLLIIGNKISSGITHESKTPILGDLPLLDRVFSSRSHIEEEYTQLFIVKPTIVSPKEAENRFKKPPIPVGSKL